MDNITPLVFRDRSEAGRYLSTKLSYLKKDKPIILALPRGGVPVAYEVAKVLGAPLDTLVVRKIGAPENPEFGIGAVAPMGVLILNNNSLEQLKLSQDDINHIVAHETKEMERRISYYQSGKYSAKEDTKVIVLVDDGLAMGVTARAAIESAKIIYKPERIIFAVPVCSSHNIDELRNKSEFICLNEIDDLGAIGNWYHIFDQVSDQEVVRLLKKASALHEKQIDRQMKK